MALCLVSQGQQGKSHQLRLLRYILGRLCRNPQCDQITKETKSVVDETIKRMELCFGLARGDCSLASLDTQAYSAFASPCCQVSTSTQAQSWQTPSSCTRTRMAFADHCQSLVRSVSFSQYSIVRGSTIEGIGEHIEEIRLGADTGDSSCDEQGEGYHPQRSLQTHAWSGVSSRHSTREAAKGQDGQNKHASKFGQIFGRFRQKMAAAWREIHQGRRRVSQCHRRCYIRLSSCSHSFGGDQRSPRRVRQHRRERDPRGQRRRFDGRYNREHWRWHSRNAHQPHTFEGCSGRYRGQCGKESSHRRATSHSCCRGWISLAQGYAAFWWGGK